MENDTMTPEQEKQLLDMKRWQPFKIICGALSPEGEFIVIARHNMRLANSYARKGWKVWRVQ